MYNYPFPPSEKQRGLFPPASRSMSTAPTPTNEEELAAARNILRSVITSSRPSPLASFFVQEEASVPPLPDSASFSKATQTDAISPQVPLEGLVRAAGMSLANFATEVKSLERRVDMQHREVLDALRELKLRRG